MAHKVGDHLLLEDGETGVVVSTGDDGTLRLKTATGIVVSSALEDDECEEHLLIAKTRTGNAS